MLRRNGIGVGIDHFQYRIKPCLYVLEGNTAIKVASFNSEETAEWFREKMEQFFDGLVQKEGQEDD